MDNSHPPVKAGLVYSDKLAKLFGLPEAQTLEMKGPLLGAALDINEGIRGGNICRLHIYFDSELAIRLPSEQQMATASSQLGQFPYGSIKKPNADIRRAIGEDVRHLANRAIVRFGSTLLTSEVMASEDSNGAYVSMPLDGYQKNFVPGVSWLVMPINCALALRGDLNHISMFLETPDSPKDLILNQIIRPSVMVEFKIPNKLLRGMKVELEQAILEDETASFKGQFLNWYKLIN
jgi:hypothetical protein